MDKIKKTFINFGELQNVKPAKQLKSSEIEESVFNYTDDKKSTNVSDLEKESDETTVTNDTSKESILAKFKKLIASLINTDTITESTTKALGEEGGDDLQATTKALGEEGGDETNFEPFIKKDFEHRATTMALGEEGGE